MCNFRLDEHSNFVSASGVYFMKMFLDRKFTEPSPDVREFTFDQQKVMKIQPKDRGADRGLGLRGKA